MGHLPCETGYREGVESPRRPGDTSQKQADVVADNFANASHTNLFDVVVGAEIVETL